MATHFTDQNFEQEVVKDTGVVLIDFFAEWCGPCKMLAPTIEKLSTEYAGKVKIGKLDVDANPNVAGKFQIVSIPTLIYFKNGQPVGMDMGFKSEEYLKNKLDSLLAA